MSIFNRQTDYTFFDEKREQYRKVAYLSDSFDDNVLVLAHDNGMTLIVESNQLIEVI